MQATRCDATRREERCGETQKEKEERKLKHIRDTRNTCARRARSPRLSFAVEWSSGSILRWPSLFIIYPRISGWLNINVNIIHESVRRSSRKCQMASRPQKISSTWRIGFWFTFSQDVFSLAFRSSRVGSRGGNRSRMAKVGQVGAEAGARSRLFEESEREQVRYETRKQRTLLSHDSASRRVRLYSCVSRNANIAWQEYFSTSTTCRRRHVRDRRTDTIVVVTNEHGGSRSTRVDLGEKGEKWERNRSSNRSPYRSIQL